MSRDIYSLHSEAAPKRTWLALGYDPAVHLVALLAANGRKDADAPVVYVARSITTFPVITRLGAGTAKHVRMPPSAKFELRPDGLTDVLVEYVPGQKPVITGVGQPRPTAHVFCDECRSRFTLSAQELNRKRLEAKPGKPRAFTIGASA